MAVEIRRGWLFSLRVKLVAVLVPLMTVCLLIAMLWLGKYLMEFFQRRAELETSRLGQAVELALRQSMLRKPELALSASLADVKRTPSIRRVWVINKHGRVAQAADPAVIGLVLDKTKDSICTVCHADRVIPDVRTVFIRDEAGTPILRHVRSIPNDKACWGCHDPKIRLNGILLLDDIVGFVSRRDFETFGLPYLHRAFGGNYTVKFFHNDAPCKMCAPGLPEAGINFLNFGIQHTLLEMKEWTGNRITLLGNVPPRDVLALGTPDDVQRSVTEMLEPLDGDYTRLVASVGGGMPPGAPTANIRAFIDTVNELTA